MQNMRLRWWNLAPIKSGTNFNQVLYANGHVMNMPNNRDF